MRMLFRVEANTHIGRGHLSRMIAVAQMLESDFSIAFIVSEKNREYCASLLQSREVYYLEKENDLFNIITKQDFLWIDGYSFDNAWRLKFRPHVFKLIYIDDFTGDIQGADVIINHCPGVAASQYVKYKGTEYFLGLDYAMLRPAFLGRARQGWQKISSTRGVFVCFGGADPKGLGVSFVRSIADAGFSDPIYFVTSSAKLEGLEAHENIRVLKNLAETEMIHYMDESAVVVVPASVLSFEAIALRKPLFTMYYVDNQSFIYKGITDLQLGVGAGYVGDTIDSGISFKAFYEDKDAQQRISKNQSFYLDGKSGVRFKMIINEWLTERN